VATASLINNKSTSLDLPNDLRLGTKLRIVSELPFPWMETITSSGFLNLSILKIFLIFLGVYPLDSHILSDHFDKAMDLTRKFDNFSSFVGFFNLLIHYIYNIRFLQILLILWFIYNLPLFIISFHLLVLFSYILGEMLVQKVLWKVQIYNQLNQILLSPYKLIGLFKILSSYISFYYQEWVV